MRGFFHYKGKGGDSARLIAKVNTMSERARSAWSNWVNTRHGNGERPCRWIPCFVFVDQNTEEHNGEDFKLNMSNGTGFMETHTVLQAGQKIAMVFPNFENQGPVEFMGKVVWVGPKVLGA